MAKIDFPKKQEQRLIPKYLLEYAEELQENHPDPTDPWGGGGGSPIEAGEGIVITGEDTKTISLDTNPETFEVTASTGMTLEVENENPLWKDSKLQMTSAGSTRLEGTEISLEANNIYLNSNNAPYYVNNTTHEYKTLATTDQLFSGDYNDLYNKPTIPTKTSELTNDSDFITSADIPTNYVTTDTAQTITGQKTWGSGNLTTSINNYSLQTKDNNRSIIYSNQGMQFDMYNSAYNKVYLTMIDHNTSPVSTTGQYIFVNGKRGNVAIEDDIPTKTSDLTNDSGFITNSALSGYATETWVQNQGYSTFDGDYNNLTNKPTIPTKTSDLTNDSGFITSSDLPTNHVTTNTNQDITGVKTFKGEDKLVLQGTTASQKPGFAILDGNDDKRGFLELRPGTGDKTMVLGVYNNNRYTDTSIYRIGLREYNQSNGDYTYSTLMPKGSDKYTTFGTGNMNMVLGVNGQTADATGNVSLTIPDTTYMVTTNTTQEITGEKTFTGNKRIKLKQSASGNKLGFTGYDTSNNELGYLEMNNNDSSLQGQSNVLGIYKSSTSTTPTYDPKLGLKYQAKDSDGTYHNYSLLAPTRAGNSTYSTKYIPISVNGTEADNTGNISISIPTVPTNVSAFTNDAGYITGITSSDVTTALGYTPGTSNFSGDYTDLTNKPDLSIYAQSADLATVATSGSYNDLTDKPTIPTVDYPVTDVQVNGTSVVTNKVANLTAGNQYIHKLTLRDSANNLMATASIITSSSTAFTTDSLAAWLYNNNYRTTANGIYEASGAYLYSSNNIPVVGIRSINGTASQALAQKGNNSFELPTIATVIDIVKEVPNLVQIPNAFYYKNGDTYTNIGYYQLYGYITNGGKDLQFTVTFNKSIENINSITVNTLAFVARGVGGYVGGTSYIDYATATGYTILTNISAENAITVTVRGDSAWSGSTNNTPVVIVIRSNPESLKLTFNS